MLTANDDGTSEGLGMTVQTYPAHVTNKLSADNQHYGHLTSVAAVQISCRSCGLLAEALGFGRPASFMDLPDVSGVLLCAGCLGFVGLVA